MTVQELTDKLADAIAFAEGFYVTNSRAYRNNNPGNLTLDLTGTSIGKDGPFVIYATALDGWEALKKQVSMMIDGTSRFYNSSMTIQEIANIYTATQPLEWARNVATRLGVLPETQLTDLLTFENALTVAEILLVGVVIVYLLSKYKG